MATKINFIPNDPLAGPNPPMRQKAPSANRPASKAGFNLAAGPPAALYAPGTPGFIHWQCREATLQAVKAWEAIAGPLTRWARSSNVKKLDLFPDFDVDLNAYYDGQSLSFFHSTAGTKTTFSGASTDVVSHEAGHGFLDAIRPDLWFSNFTETGAFHEAFGDSIAIVAALSDPATRRAVLQQGLTGSNFVEATAEDLSDGIRRDPRYGPTHAASQPRHAFNSFQWQLPTTLPTSGGPNVLTSEVHSFARVFTGCFYDSICNIFASLGAPTEARLESATRTVAKRIQATGAALDVGVVKIAGQPLAQAVHRRDVPLGAVSPRLKGVVARVAETVLVGKVQPGAGKAAARSAIVSALPDPQASADEVQAFVETLLKNDGVDLDGSRARGKAAARGAIAGRQAGPGRPLPTQIRVRPCSSFSSTWVAPGGSGPGPGRATWRLARSVFSNCLVSSAA